MIAIGHVIVKRDLSATLVYSRAPTCGAVSASVLKTGATAIHSTILTRYLIPVRDKARAAHVPKLCMRFCSTLCLGAGVCDVHYVVLGIVSFFSTYRVGGVLPSIMPWHPLILGLWC